MMKYNACLRFGQYEPQHAVTKTVEHTFSPLGLLIYQLSRQYQIMSVEPREPTPAVHRVSPLYDVYGGTLYPYVNHKLSGITPYLTAFKRAIAPFNPFALQQVPTTDSVGLADKYGERWWMPDPYPSRITQQFHYNSHYDPFANPRYVKPPTAKVISPSPGFTVQAFPRHCTRSLEAYKTCLIANDQSKDKCASEGTDILAICPPWALDKMKDNQRLRLKLEAQANLKYRRAMEVSDYNQGRTVADVPARSWVDGERSNLRPNSIWADDRYVDITQKEVDQAKQRVKRRNLSRGIKANTSVHYEAYDRTYEAPSTQIPLYP